MKNQVVHPEGWAPAKGYANGILARDGTLYVAGQVGWNAQQVFETDTFIGQMRQALRNILEIVETAGGKPQDVLRMTWFVTDENEYIENQRAVGEAYRDLFGKHFPAMSLVIVKGLIETGALLEIEATALVEPSSRPLTK
jgi:enamine deaminase RidA (YjgF/YER057c/UK114 family)